MRAAKSRRGGPAEDHATQGSLRRLDELRANVPELRDGPLNLAALASHVLVLPPAWTRPTPTAPSCYRWRGLRRWPTRPAWRCWPGSYWRGEACRPWTTSVGTWTLLPPGSCIFRPRPGASQRAVPAPARPSELIRVLEHRSELIRLLERAAGADVDLGDVVRLGAYHLSTQGSPAGDRIIRRPDDTSGGRDWNEQADAPDVGPVTVAPDATVTPKPRTRWSGTSRTARRPG
ncbi:hypothetical protein NKH18_45235 [Streptomyces sp. M10(2022)]